MRIHSILYTVISLLFVSGLLGQSCLPKGPLRWIGSKGLAQDYMVEYGTASGIYGLYFSRQSIDSLHLTLKVDKGDENEISLPLIPLKKRLKPIAYLPCTDYFYLLPFSPERLLADNATHLKIASLMMAAAEEGKSYIVLDYIVPKSPSIKGCIAIDLRLDSINKYEKPARYRQASLQIEAVESEIKSRRDSLLYLEDIRKAAWNQVLEQRDQLPPLREKMERLPDIHKKALLEIADILDNVTYAKQQISSGLIDDESRMEALFEQYAEKLLAYKRIAPNEQALDLLVKYNALSEKIQQSYFIISEMQQSIKYNKLKINDLNAQLLIFRKDLGRE